MAMAKNPWTAFWKKYRQTFESDNLAKIDRLERDNLLLARDVLTSLSVDWVPVWSCQNPAYWILARLGAIEVQGTFHWDKFKPKRKPRSLIIAAEFTGDYMPEEIHEKALAAGMVHQNLREINRDVATFRRFAHAVRRGSFATGLLSLRQEQFVVVAARICVGQPELPPAVARVALLRHFEDYCCPIDGLCFVHEEPEVFTRPRSMDEDAFTEEYRSPEEWCWVLSELPDRNGEPISLRTFSRWVVNGRIRIDAKSKRSVAVQRGSLPDTMRNSKESRDAIVAKFHRLKARSGK